MDCMASASVPCLLGPSPFVRGLGWWALGAGYCVGVWHLHQAFPLPGLLFMGLAPFVNLFCFFKGLNALRRAWLHWLTRRAATRLGLTPTWGSGVAGFFLVDEAREVCVTNGAVIPFAEVASLALCSTPMAHRLLLEVTSPRQRRPHEVGFADRASLLEALHRLRAALERCRPAPLAVWEQEAGGERTPLAG